MTSEEHIKLADFIKSTHKKLREETKILGTEQAWDNHYQDEENLKKYAFAMKKLALEHWEENSKKGGKVISRVAWVYEACKEYFSTIQRHRDKEIRIMKTHSECSEISIPPYEQELVKYKLLDVGSCYNPFTQYEIFDVTAIDIAPANAKVFKCDFLNLKMGYETVIKDQMVLQLKQNVFDIVVFSLLLEYFPSPEQRLQCCLKAFKLLKVEGILVVITPDSNHVGANAKIFKSWQYVLAQYGFIRVKYEKLPYIHCMVFRKAQFQKVACRWAKVHKSEDLYDKIFIPQDFSKIKFDELGNSLNKDDWNPNTFLEEFDCTIFG